MCHSLSPTTAAKSEGKCERLISGKTDQQLPLESTGRKKGEDSFNQKLGIVRNSKDGAGIDF
jgi:hypothetical protein